MGGLEDWEGEEKDRRDRLGGEEEKERKGESIGRGGTEGRRIDERKRREEKGRGGGREDR